MKKEFAPNKLLQTDALILTSFKVLDVCPHVTKDFMPISITEYVKFAQLTASAVQARMSANPATKDRRYQETCALSCQTHAQPANTDLIMPASTRAHLERSFEMDSASDSAIRVFITL